MASIDLPPLVAKLARQLDTLQARNLDHLGLRMGTALILREIITHWGITHGQISTRMKLDKSTVTNAVRKLVGAGYVEKKTDPGDGRSHLLLSTNMSKVLEPLFDFADQNLAETVLHGFSEKETQEFGKYLRRASANVNHVLDSPPVSRFKHFLSGPNS